MNEKWISSFGKADETQAKSLIQDAVDANCDLFCCAFFSDSFRSCSLKVDTKASLQTILDNLTRLLEIRLFNNKSELWLHRSMLGVPFEWRLADDCQLKESLSQESDPFLSKIESYRIETIQVLDIDSSFVEPADDLGARRLRTTGGGIYTLPIQEESDAVVVVFYLRYDPNGVVSIADYRLSGFTNEKEWRADHGR